MSELDRDAIHRLLDAAGAQLTGEWLLVGGAASALWFDSERLTEDVDLIGLGGTPEERMALMDLAASLGISPEVVNSAADFFVRRIPGWRDEIEVLQTGPSCTIFRPSATLFLLLKIGRLTEKDLADCLGLLAHVERVGLRLDRQRVRAAIAALPPGDPARAGRRATLLSRLGGA